MTRQAATGSAAPPHAGHRAVVLGASIAGTLAARVLTESYDEVVMIDRDRVLGVTAPRRGAPHAVHAHGLHAGGYRLLAELFPGLLDEARELPGLSIRDFGLMRWYFDGRPISRAETGLLSIAGSRPVLENHLRSRVAALPGVQVREETELLALTADAGRERITGVRLRSVSDDRAYHLDADLVVDATGRGSRLPVWLGELGYPRPAEERMPIGLAYTTRTFRRRPGTFGGPEAINPVASPAHPRGAFFGQAATGDCRLSLTGILGDRPPTDPDAFLDFARTLPVADIHDAISDAEPIGDAASFTFPASVWRHYERLDRFPAGLVVLGDAFASFNPVYGQGMTVAARQADVLRCHLRRHAAVHPRRLLRDMARAMAAPWIISTRGDLDFAGVPGPRPARVRLFNAYQRRVQYAMSRDPAVTRAFMHVTGLVDPPRALWRPSVVARVLRHAWRMPAAQPRTEERSLTARR
ncbi:FAD-dependent oxidoreductase [Actinoplanes teichomyceticus]|uniref:2-polyprenyl-6-methoxyphenol hydroxylase-like FAD-dependent oxidoreductase n=1 Tax=Actinoplanes teichomyceticus TaxID=1867 RepID=A0A561WBV8_ACTTI|nr:FAD-dependent monooxygenase [Actinoplanes teichomyceticus]TWG21339.1 2-polyprenyl-6-methoxyphenol hydroxylase-like FAD-dependent oxidoreductase [Actinoplanes teichomyceticus]GIF16424.1 FAD-binding monooxygenase [Actinoplanes teichomyceticus]